MLKAFLVHTLKAVWHHRIAEFWPIWVTITVVAAISAAWMVGRAVPPTVPEAKNAPIDVAQTRRHFWSRGAAAALAMLGIFLGCYIVLILTWEDFAYYDNETFTLFTLRGHDFAMMIWPQLGRVLPLGLQEFNLIRHFTRTVAGYHALPIVQLLILSYVLLILDDELSLASRAVLTAIALTTLGMVFSFTSLFVPERNVLFSLACLVFCVKRFEKSWSAAWAVAAVVSAQIMINYKETASLLLLGFALGRLILRCKNAVQVGWNRDCLRDKESRLDLCLASLGVLFLLYYLAVMFPHVTMQYANRMRLPRAEVILAYLKADLLAWLLVAVVLGRAYQIVRSRVAPLPLWDGLALGGVAYFVAYLYLSMFGSYYLAPVDVIAVLYIGRIAILSRRKIPGWGRVAALTLLIAVVLQGISLSAVYLYQRKNGIHAKAEIARVVEARNRSGAQGALTLFFPFASPYVIMEFAAYLDYRGVPVEGVPVESNRLNQVIMVSAAVANDGPCVEYRDLVCRAGAGGGPGAGALVVVLPDDEASLADVTPYQDRGELVFSYSPHPRIPPWLYGIVNCFRIASPREPSVPVPAIWHKNLPDRWLHAAVFAWK